MDVRTIACHRVIPIAAIMLARWGPGAAAQSAQCDGRTRLGVVYANTATGERHREGIDQSVAQHAWSANVCVDYFPYVNRDQGVATIRGLIQDQSVDVILGPTESDVFVRLAEREADLSVFRVPVVSGLVTAPVGNRSDGWFFRTNLDVTRRSQAIYDYLNKGWLRAIAVLYGNSEFGRRAEAAFAEELTSMQRTQYLPLLYETPPNPRDQLRQILDERPEAVGLFVEREEVEPIVSELYRMNPRTRRYRPILFTVIDARRIVDQVPDLVSVAITPVATDSAAGDLDDVWALGHDTGLLVLNELERLGATGRLDTLARRQLRDQLAVVLRNSVHQVAMQSSMRFSEYENNADPVVLRQGDDSLQQVAMEQVLSWTDKVRQKLRLTFALHGAMPALVLVMFLVISGLLTGTDFRQMFSGSDVKIYANRYFWLFWGGNLGAMIVLYVFLAETGRISYGSLVTAVVIGIAPSALFRTTIFETPTGRAIGLEQLYRRALAYVDTQLMLKRYDALAERENVIAYYNSQTVMREALFEIYRKHPVEHQRGRLIQELDMALQGESNYLERRRMLARKLMKQFAWDRLRAEGFVPPHWDDAHPLDPRKIVRSIARKCVGDPAKEQLVANRTKEVLSALRKRNLKRYREVTDFLKTERNEALAVEGELNVNVRFLLVLEGFKLDWFREHGLLDDDEVATAAPPARRSVRQRLSGMSRTRSATAK